MGRSMTASPTCCRCRGCTDRGRKSRSTALAAGRGLSPRHLTTCLWCRAAGDDNNATAVQPSPHARLDTCDYKQVTSSCSCVTLTQAQSNSLPFAAIPFPFSSRLIIFPPFPRLKDDVSHVVHDHVRGTQCRFPFCDLIFIVRSILDHRNQSSNVARRQHLHTIANGTQARVARHCRPC